MHKIKLVVSMFLSFWGAIRGVLLKICWKLKLGHFGAKSIIYPYVVIHGPYHVTIGESVTIAEFVHIWGGGGVEIGDHTSIAAHSVIASVTHDTSGPVYRNTRVKKKVVIGRNVWIGSGAVILPGITIGDDAIIGAGAVVTKDVSARAIMAGVPARLLRYTNSAYNGYR